MLIRFLDPPHSWREWAPQGDSQELPRGEGGIRSIESFRGLANLFALEEGVAALRRTAGRTIDSKPLVSGVEYDALAAPSPRMASAPPRIENVEGSEGEEAG